MTHWPNVNVCAFYGEIGYRESKNFLLFNNPNVNVCAFHQKETWKSFNKPLTRKTTQNQIIDKKNKQTLLIRITVIRQQQLWTCPKKTMLKMQPTRNNVRWIIHRHHHDIILWWKYKYSTILVQICRVAILQWTMYINYATITWTKNWN